MRVLIMEPMMACECEKTGDRIIVRPLPGHETKVQAEINVLTLLESVIIVAYELYPSTIVRYRDTQITQAPGLAESRKTFPRMEIYPKLFRDSGVKYQH